MFTVDQKLKGLPASADQVLALHQSINSPHLAVPGRKAGPAKSFIAGLKGPHGGAVFVYLHLPESAECAVYSAPRRDLTADQFKQAEAEALAFAESMGFMMDNMNFRTLPPEEQAELLRTLPVFQRDPKMLARAGEQEAQQSKVTPLGRLLSSF